MPLSTYSDLQTAVLSWLARPGDPLVAPSVPDMVRLFEAEATRRLKTGAAEKQVTVTTVAGVSSVPLPADFGQLRRASYNGVTLAYVGPTSLPGLSGPPLAYTLWGATNLWLGPTPDTAYEIELLYQSGVPPLSDSNPSNWLLAAHPDAYLFGVLTEAELYIGHDERVQIWAQRREAAFASIEMADRKARWGSPLQIQVDGITVPAGGGASGGADSAMASVSVGSAAPSNPHSGDLWWDSSTGIGGGQLYVWYIDASGDAAWTAATNQPGSPGPATDGVITVTPASGDTVIVNAAQPSVYVLSPALAALTVRLSALPMNGSTVQLCFAAPVTTLSIQDSDGTPVAGAATSAYGPAAALIFRHNGTQWVPWK
jgi:hypothetical protein